MSDDDDDDGDGLPTVEAIRLSWRKRGRDDNDPECVAEVLAVVRIHLGMGKDDAAVMEAMDCPPSELRRYKEQLYGRDSAQLTKRPAEEVFLDYKWRMDAVVTKLENITTGAKGARQFAAAMGAQKAIAQIHDTVMDRGQEMGVIARASKRTEVVGGLIVGHLDGKELLAAIKTATDSTRKMIEEYGGGESMEHLAIGDVYEDAVVVPPVKVKVPTKVIETTSVPTKATKKVGEGAVTRVRSKK